MVRLVLRRGNGSRLVVLGLTDENVRRLTADEPILVRGTTLDMPEIDVVIVHGATEQALIDSMKKAGVEVPIDRAPIVSPGRPVTLRSTDGGKRGEG